MFVVLKKQSYLPFKRTNLNLIKPDFLFCDHFNSSIIMLYRVSAEGLERYFNTYI